VFLLFQRLHDRENYDGIGMGLTISRKIVERHGGRIWYESQPGEGTTFFFTLPAVQQKAA
jgi:light-regulated signal transduction histidine kinase (bacteriophytochrome)